jgi:hypothetical protein
VNEPAIGFKQRVLTVGMTQSGKTTFDRYAFVNMHVRRVLVDVKGELRVAGTRRVDLTATNDADAKRQVDSIDWDQPIVHVHPGYLVKPQLEALYKRIMEVPGDLWVWTTESYGVSTASWSPLGLRQLQTAGAGLGKGHNAESQRPVDIEKVLRTEADHVFLFPPLSTDDLKAALEGVPFLDAKRALELFNGLPEHGYLWADRRRKKVSIGPPLPAELRAYKTDVVAFT